MQVEDRPEQRFNSAQVRKEVAASSDENLKTLYQEWVLVKNQMINSFNGL